MTKGLQPGASSQPAGLTLRSFQLKAVALLDRALKDAAGRPAHPDYSRGREATR